MCMAWLPVAASAAPEAMAKFEITERVLLRSKVDGHSGGQGQAGVRVPVARVIEQHAQLQWHSTRRPPGRLFASKKSLSLVMRAGLLVLELDTGLAEYAIRQSAGWKTKRRRHLARHPQPASAGARHWPGRPSCCVPGAFTASASSSSSSVI